MNCPVCRNTALCGSDLAGNLEAMLCRQCGGRWVRSFHYWKWLDKQQAGSADKPHVDVPAAAVMDSPAGKLCPECGHFLTQRKVGHGVDFCLDRCNSCGGIWFDANEWEVLMGLGLHDHVHFIFSAGWQKEVRDAEAEATRAKRVEAIVGPADFVRLQETAAWINTHPAKSVLLGYLLDKQPG
ncbi:MAG: zf-TFIIB domain-containing protein [Phycisphaerae bacterium]|nr:zf-TFIIB domain-containing protein [Phycisphaerae bacterium]